MSEIINDKIKRVLSLNTHESIVLYKIIKNGSVTVRDLLPFMNYPCGPIRDLQERFGIGLVWDWEEKEKPYINSKGEEKTKKIKFKRYRLAEQV